MISQSDKKRFRAIAHHLKPCVTVASKGLTETVMSEINRALNDHELIKIKVVQDRDERKETVARVCDTTNSELVQAIGGIAVIFKKAAKPDPSLSNLTRTDIL